MIEKLTHDELCARAVKWLRGSMGCKVAVSELVTPLSEIPDAIGFNGYHSFLVECKTNKVDFLREKNKLHRRQEAKGHRKCLGKYRFFLCPKGIIKPEDLPPKWGLLYVCGKVIRRVVFPQGQNSFYYKHSTWKDFEHDNDVGAEHKIMYSIARRFSEGENHIWKRMHITDLKIVRVVNER